MVKYDLGTVVAERKYSLVRGEEVKIEIGMPQLFSDSEDYFCPYRITTPGRELLLRAGGVDGIQAMQIAFQKIGAALHEINLVYKNSLRWEGGEEGDLGFPFPDHPPGKPG
jgi:hypothetical protein